MNHHSDSAESAEPPPQAAKAPRGGFKAFQAQDMALFGELLEVDQVDYCGQTRTTDSIYETLRRYRGRPVRFPGLWLQEIHDRTRGEIDEVLAEYNIERWTD